MITGTSNDGGVLFTLLIDILRSDKTTVLVPVLPDNDERHPLGRVYR